MGAAMAASDAKAQAGPVATPEPDDDLSDTEDVTGLYSGLGDISSALQAMLISSSTAETDAAPSALGLPPPPPDVASDDEDDLLDFAGGGLDLANPFTDFGWLMTMNKEKGGKDVPVIASNSNDG